MKKLAALLLLLGITTGSIACAATVTTTPERGYISVNTTANTESASTEIGKTVEEQENKKDTNVVITKD